ncbi:MAG TPA: DNA polymerase I, partial [Flavobacteriales bacterium]|nr:DNA polymerase I [Flavobacteriales bacterium]
YNLVDTAPKRTALIKELEAAPEFCFDTETTGLDPLVADIIGMSFSCKKGEASYVPLLGNEEEVISILNEFRHLFENEEKIIIAQNLKYDLKILHKYGLSIKGKVFDTMIAHYILHPDSRHNMNVLAETFLNYRPISIETLIGKKGKNQTSMRDADLNKVSEYAGEDADITFQLKEVFGPLLEKDKLTDLFNNIEMPLVQVLAEMEEEGIRLDVDTLKAFSNELTADLTDLEKDILKMAGTDFNIDSPKQLGQILFEVLVITDKPPKTKTGQYSTSEDVLAKLTGKHEIVEKVLSYRSLKKLKTTYADSLPNEVSEMTGRIHTTYSQTIAATGRLSSVSPNLQNIPIKTARGREIRKAFIPRDSNHLLLSADYSQIELRIIAALSGDENMIAAFKNNEDIHTSTAAKIFGVKPDEVDREMRTKAKSVNFGIIYGVSSFGLAQNINSSRSEAKEIIDSYFAQYPGVRQYMDQSIENARKQGYVETIMKRRRYLRDINSSNGIVRGAAERNAINAPIQGSAADIIKLAMINIHRQMEKENFSSKMLLQVHDELVFDARKDELDRLKILVRQNMEHAVKLDVPLIVEMNAADNWLDAH